MCQRNHNQHGYMPSAHPGRMEVLAKRLRGNPVAGQSARYVEEDGLIMTGF
jgi:hypothetical protein